MDFKTYVLVILGCLVLAGLFYYYVLLPFGDWREDRRAEKQRRADEADRW